MTRARFGRTGFAVLLAVMLTMALAAPASAAPAPGQITCVATPRVHISQNADDPAIFDWSIHGDGACVAAKGTLTVRIDGEGQGRGLGFCTGLFVQDLVIPMTITVQRVFSGETYTRNAIWFAPVTTFPEATPFLVADPAAAGVAGAGTIFTHIFFGCVPDNPRSDSSTVVWTQEFGSLGGPPA
jgi:hypothetical protein